MKWLRSNHRQRDGFCAGFPRRLVRVHLRAALHEEVKLSYATLRDHAFNVTGGSVERAQRTDKPSNIAWLITVKPQGNGDVTVVLPVTTDCNAAGAVFTGDGRKLSNRLEFTVSGPDG